MKRALDPSDLLILDIVRKHQALSDTRYARALVLARRGYIDTRGTWYVTDKAPLPMVPHAPWDAPRVVTHEANDYRTPECRRAEWSGENVYSGGAARCIPMPHWDAIVAEAERVGWPLHYRRDLYVHDRASIAHTSASEPFLWVLRECGTCFYPVSYFDGVGHGAVHFAESIPHIFGSKVCRLYSWDGRNLREHKTPETAAEAMRVLRRRWEGKEEEGDAYCHSLE